MGVMHRNIKPENILIDEINDENCDIAKCGLNFSAKLADFALSRSIQVPHLEKYTPEDPKERERSGREARRLYYRAPELMFRPNHYSFEIDMWAVGCVFAEMALTEPLFKNNSELELLLHIFRLTGSPDRELIEKFISSGSDYSNPMINFPAWKRIPFSDICSNEE